MTLAHAASLLWRGHYLTATEGRFSFVEKKTVNNKILANNL